MTNALQLARRYWPYAVVASAFIASRWVYRNFVGIEFDTSPTTFYIQYLDPWFIEHDFARSLLYLHHQGPLQNLLVGGAIRLLGQAHAFQLLEALYTCFAFGTALGLLHVCLRLGVRKPIAIVSCALYAVSPTTVVYENWLFYHTPVALCLVLSLGALIHYHRARSFRAALLFFSLIATAALFRSTFGPLFLIAALALLWLRPPLEEKRSAARKTLLKAAAIPLALLILNGTKPWLLTGHGYGETFFWGNLSTKIKEALPASKLEELEARGVVSHVPRFPLADLREFGKLRVPHAPTGVPLLDMERAPHGSWNAHALEYLLLTDKYYKPDAIYLLSHYPKAYLKSIGHALGEYVGSSLDDSTLPGLPNYQRVRPASDLIDRAYARRDDKSRGLLGLVLPLLCAYGVYRLTRAAARRGSQRCSVTAITYVLFTAVYVAGISVLVSSGDFARYRFEVDPLHVLLLALLLSDLSQLVAALASRLAHATRSLDLRLSSTPRG